jgi:hypothetical protein
LILRFTTAGPVRPNQIPRDQFAYYYVEMSSEPGEIDFIIGISLSRGQPLVEVNDWRGDITIEELSIAPVIEGRTVTQRIPLQLLDDPTEFRWYAGTEAGPNLNLQQDRCPGGGGVRSDFSEDLPFPPRGRQGESTQTDDPQAPADDPPTPEDPSQPAEDPGIAFCPDDLEALGPFVQGVDPEYDPAMDWDGDGVSCE